MAECDAREICVLTETYIRSKHLPVNVNNRNTTKNWNMFRANNIGTGTTDMVKHELQVTSYELRVESLKARVEIQMCEFYSKKNEFNSMSSNSGVTSSTLRVTRSDFWVTSLNSRNMSSNPRVVSSNPRVQESFNHLITNHFCHFYYGPLKSLTFNTAPLKVQSLLSLLPKTYQWNTESSM